MEAGLFSFLIILMRIKNLVKDAGLTVEVMKQSAHQVLEVDNKPSDDFLTFEDAATDKSTQIDGDSLIQYYKKMRKKSVVYNLFYFLFSSILCFYLFQFVSIPVL